MADLFREIIPSILETKKPFMLTDHDERTYPSFMVNRALSYYRDTALIANEINKYPNLDNKMKADFLLNMIRSGKRPYAKWHKKDLNDLMFIKEYYGYSDAKAYEALSLLSDAQITNIKEQQYKGD